YLEKIESMGGAVKCIETGYQADEIAKSAYEFEKEIEENRRVIVGINRFEEDDDEKVPLLKIDDSIQKKQVEILHEVKKSRDNDKVKKSLTELQNAAETNVNILPYILQCVESYASIGEISNSLRNVWGEY
ncbi:MAG TPA: methylmalonyl-CoA mutase family protein, partial [Ignavibacteria bacterium]|nr:methylmalonyl-CoA mutase family protein [Ignavibacteria bacterium]